MKPETQMIDMQFDISDHGDEVTVHMMSADGTELTPQALLDAFVEFIQHQYGILPKAKGKMDS